MDWHRREPSTNTAVIRPCWHMRGWISALADGSLSGLARRYANAHLSGCPRCRAALEALRALRDRLRALGRAAASGQDAALADERHRALSQALDEIDHKDG